MTNLNKEKIIKERLNHTYDLIDYEVDGNINNEYELSFLDDVFKYMIDNGTTFNNAIWSAIDNIEIESSQEILKDYAYYISEYIDEYIREHDVRCLDEILYGGVYRYLEVQCFKNRDSIFKNILYSMMNKEIDAIKKSSNLEVINCNTGIFLNFDTDVVEDYIDEFVDEKLYSLDEMYPLEIYELFCDFLNLKK